MLYTSAVSNSITIYDRIFISSYPLDRLYSPDCPPLCRGLLTPPATALVTDSRENKE